MSSAQCVGHWRDASVCAGSFCSFTPFVFPFSRPRSLTTFLFCHFVVLFGSQSSSPRSLVLLFSGFGLLACRLLCRPASAKRTPVRFFQSVCLYFLSGHGSVSSFRFIMFFFISIGTLDFFFLYPGSTRAVPCCRAVPAAFPSFIPSHGAEKPSGRSDRRLTSRETSFSERFAK